MTEIKKHISFSEYHTYKQCPHKWYLSYLLEIKDPTNEFLIFGGSLHETIEEILLDPEKESQQQYILEEKIKKTSNTVFSNSFFGKNMARDGVGLLKELNFYKRFKGIDIVGVEDDIYEPLFEMNGEQFYFKGFIDFEGKYKKEERYIILDWKTGIKEWDLKKKCGSIPFDNFYSKLVNKETLSKEEEESLQAKIFFGQTSFYKHYFSLKYNIPKENIDIEYCVLVRNPISVKEYRVEMSENFNSWIFNDLKEVATEVFKCRISPKALKKIKIEKKCKKYCQYCYFNKKDCHYCNEEQFQFIKKEDGENIET